MKKKMTIIAATALLLSGCYNIVDDKDKYDAWTNHGMSCYTKVVEIEGHKYILMDGSYAGTIVHAASCHCMEKRKLP